MKQHWAQLEDAFVVKVIVTDDSLTDENRESELSERLGGQWLRTDKNAFYGNPKDGETPIIRGTFAGVGYSYNSTLDIFIPPMPEEPGDWEFNPATYQWELV